MNMDELKYTLKDRGYIITKPIDDDDNIRLIINGYVICGMIIIDKKLITTSNFGFYIELQSFEFDDSVDIFYEIPSPFSEK